MPATALPTMLTYHSRIAPATPAELMGPLYAEVAIQLRRVAGGVHQGSATSRVAILADDGPGSVVEAWSGMATAGDQQTAKGQ